MQRECTWVPVLVSENYSQTWYKIVIFLCWEKHKKKNRYKLLCASWMSLLLKARWKSMWAFRCEIFLQCLSVGQLEWNDSDRHRICPCVTPWKLPPQMNDTLLSYLPTPRTFQPVAKLFTRFFFWCLVWYSGEVCHGCENGNSVAQDCEDWAARQNLIHSKAKTNCQASVYLFGKRSTL